MRVSQEFNRFAHTYQQSSYIQKEVAKRLISMLPPNSGSRYADIGCGDGAIYRALLNSDRDIERFIAIDLAPNMLKLHPDAHNIYKMEANFDDISPNSFLSTQNIDVIISSSALQWSKNIDNTISNLSKLAPYGAFAIFTNATFQDLLNYLNVPSPILPLDTILEALLNSYYPDRVYIQNIKLPFNSNREMLNYIKKSGVSGARMLLSYRDIKRFINRYSRKELDFQILYFAGKSLSKNRPIS